MSHLAPYNRVIVCLFIYSETFSSSIVRYCFSVRNFTHSLSHHGGKSHTQIILGNSVWETAFFKYWKLKITSKLWLLQLHVGYQIKELIIIFNLMGLAVKLKGFCHEIFFKNMILAPNFYFKVSKIGTSVIYFHLLKKGVLKLLYDKCRVNTYEILPQSF